MTLMKSLKAILKPGSKFKISQNIAIFSETEKLKAENKKYSGFYNVIADLYDFGSRLYFQFYGGETTARKEFLEKLRITAKDKVLEVSIGTGINIPLLPKTAEYFGVDISYGMLKKCQSNLQKAHRETILIQAEAEKLPFKNNTFECVFHIGGINYFNNKQKAINEMIRVAKPGSYITIVDETDKFFQTFSWVPFLKYFFQTGESTQPPLNLLPKSVRHLSLTEVVSGNYWRLTFQKPIVR